jgi:hypothetical protein
MISSANYAQPAPAQSVAITMQDGTIWHTDASLPADTEISRALADWLEAGGVISPHVVPVRPRAVHAAWIKAALADIGKLSAVNAAVAAAGPVKAALWDSVTTVREDHSDIVAIAAALRIDLPALFTRAEQIRDENHG